MDKHVGSGGMVPQEKFGALWLLPRPCFGQNATRISPLIVSTASEAIIKCSNREPEMTPFFSLLKCDVSCLKGLFWSFFEGCFCHYETSHMLAPPQFVCSSSTQILHQCSLLVWKSRHNLDVPNYDKPLGKAIHNYVNVKVPGKTFCIVKHLTIWHWSGTMLTWYLHSSVNLEWEW